MLGQCIECLGILLNNAWILYIEGVKVYNHIYKKKNIICSNFKLSLTLERSGISGL